MAEGGFTNLLIGIAAVVVIFVGLNYVGVVPDFAGVAQTPEEKAAVVETTVETDDLQCFKGADFSNTGTVGPMSRWMKPTENVGGLDAYIFESAERNGKYEPFTAANKIGAKDDSATDTFGGLNKLGIIYGYANESFYERWVEFKVPCKKFLTSQYDTGSNELVKNASSGLTIKIKPSDQGTTDTTPGDGTHNESIGAGQYGSWDIIIETIEEEGISAGTDELGKVFKQGYSFEFNKSLYDETTFSISGLSKGTLPDYYTEAQTDSLTVFYETTGCPDPTQKGTTYCTVNLGTLKLASESGENPAGGSQQDAASVGRGDIKVCSHDQGFFVDTDSGAPDVGYADNDGVAVGFLSGSDGSSNCWLLSVD